MACCGGNTIFTSLNSVHSLEICDMCSRCEVEVEIKVTLYRLPLNIVYMEVVLKLKGF